MNPDGRISHPGGEDFGEPCHFGLARKLGIPTLHYTELNRLHRNRKLHRAAARRYDAFFVDVRELPAFEALVGATFRRLGRPLIPLAPTDEVQVRIRSFRTLVVHLQGGCTPFEATRDRRIRSAFAPFADAEARTLGVEAESAATSKPDAGWGTTWVQEEAALERELRSAL